MNTGVEAQTAREARLFYPYSRIFGTLDGGILIVERVQRSGTNRQVLGGHDLCSLYPVQFSCNSLAPSSLLIPASLSKEESTPRFAVPPGRSIHLSE